MEAAVDQVLLGIDVGSSRVKALLVGRDGRDVARAGVATPFVAVGGGTEVTVDALLGAVASAVAGLGGAQARVAGIGVAGMAECGAPLDRSGIPLAPVLAWHDRRGEGVADRLQGMLGDGLAGRIGQRLRYVSTVAKLGWLVDQGLPAVDRWLGVPELVLQAVTGAVATEHSLAARTGCRDVVRGTWIHEVAAAAGFDVRVFPVVLPAGEAMGRVTASAADRFGFPSGIPVTVAGHDHLVGLAGCGATGDDLANSVGTAETVVARVADVPDVAEALRRGLTVTVLPGGREWAVLASAARSGPVLDAAAATLGHTLANLDRLAVGADLLDAPGVAESLRHREPPPLPAGPAGAVWHTLLHELAAQTARAVVQVVGLVGPRSRVIVFGGGSASAPWLVAKAELTPLPVWRMPTPDAVARGAALAAGVAAGWWHATADAPKPTLLPV